MLTAKAMLTAPPEKDRPLSSLSLIRMLVTGGARNLRKPAKSVLFVQGHCADAIYYIVEGRVETTVLSPQGKEGTIALHTNGAFVGEVCLTGQRHHLDCATAVTDCELLVLDPAQMRAVLNTRRRAAEYFTNFLLQRTLDVQADLVDHLFNSSEKRLARVLLLLAKFGHETRLQPINNVTQDMLAQRVGTTRARVSFFMNKFRRLGLIDYNGAITVYPALLEVVLQNSQVAPDEERTPTFEKSRGAVLASASPGVGVDSAEC